MVYGVLMLSPTETRTEEEKGNGSFNLKADNGRNDCMWISKELQPALNRKSGTPPRSLYNTARHRGRTRWRRGRINFFNCQCDAGTAAAALVVRSSSFGGPPSRGDVAVWCDYFVHTAVIKWWCGDRSSQEVMHQINNLFSNYLCTMMEMEPFKYFVSSSAMEAVLLIFCC